MDTLDRGHTEPELEKEAETMAKGLAPGERASVIALFGDLGAGKTTFTKSFAKALGVEESVTSPTFVIEKRYPLSKEGFTTFIHIDAYRLDDADELRKLHWQEDVSDPRNVIVIEWADKVEQLLPPGTVRINLAFLDEHTRSFAYDRKQ